MHLSDVEMNCLRLLYMMGSHATRLAFCEFRQQQLENMCPEQLRMYLGCKYAKPCVWHEEMCVQMQKHNSEDEDTGGLRVQQLDSVIFVHYMNTYYTFEQVMMDFRSLLLIILFIILQQCSSSKFFLFYLYAVEVLFDLLHENSLSCSLVEHTLALKYALFL